MNSPSNRHGQRGMSLVEVLVALAIFVVIIVAALLLYDRSNRVFKTGVESADMQQNTRVAFDKIAADLRMAGFDYDRDGVPSGAIGGVNLYQQPDEQIEHAGVSSITIRANFDHETDGPDNGRETAQEATSGGHFPVVTTGNDEIVTYALESADASKNTGTIRFYADVPDRRAYPGAGGRTENLVTITGVDLTNNNPPYTLFRYTLAPDTGAITVVRTPLANNIRSLRFEYFEDPGATRPLTNLATTPVVVAEAIDSVGVGQFDPNSPAAVPIRNIRAKIQSVRMTLTGMNESPDAAFRDIAETSPVAVYGFGPTINSANFRKHRLQTVIVPRNYQKSGMKEQETASPGAPVITKVCIGYCGIAYLEWDSPEINATQGSPEDYQILYGTSSTTATQIGATLGLTNSGYITIPPSGLNQTYYFAVNAVNSYGSTPSAVEGPFSLKNATKPAAPDMTAWDATGNAGGFKISGGGGTQPAAEPNQIVLEWTASPTNASGAISCPFGGGSGPPNDVREIAGFNIWRNAGSPNFNVDPMDPGVVQVASIGSGIQVDPISGRATFVDTTAANCIDYYYKIQQIERCPNADQNTTGDPATNESAVSVAIMGRAESTTKPNGPSDLIIVSANSSCGTAAPFDCTQIELSWPKVDQDITNNPVTIAEYEITRRKYNAANTVVASDLEPVTAANAVSWGDNIVWRDTNLTKLQRTDPLEKFEYEVRAKGLCPGTDLSDPSPSRIYPCSFVATPITVNVSDRFEGTGLSAGDPWLVTSGSATVTVTTGVTVAKIRAIVNPGNLLLGEATNTASAAFPWPIGLSPQTYSVSISAEDFTGCVGNAVRYLEEYAFNCCLVPVTIDSSIRNLDGPSGEERFRLINICNQPLRLTGSGEGVQITWERDALTGQGGSDKLDIRYFPTAPGQNPPTGAKSVNDNEGTITYQPEGTQLTHVPVDVSGIGDDYWVRFKYSKSFSPTLAPTENLCIKYRVNGTGNLRQCRIFPAPSTTLDSCN
jgi:prepilin-type N-terminal cleavage/methylation domain-containing protein